jgi:hypothetical protein
VAINGGLEVKTSPNPLSLSAFSHFLPPASFPKIAPFVHKKSIFFSLFDDRKERERRVVEKM